MESLPGTAEGKLLERAVASSAHTRPCPTWNSTAGGAAPECFPSTEPEISETLTPALQRPCRSCREVEANGGAWDSELGKQRHGGPGQGLLRMRVVTLKLRGLEDTPPLTPQSLPVWGQVGCHSAESWATRMEPGLRPPRCKGTGRGAGSGAALPGRPAAVPRPSLRRAVASRGRVVHCVSAAPQAACPTSTRS